MLQLVKGFSPSPSSPFLLWAVLAAILFFSRHLYVQVLGQDEIAFDVETVAAFLAVSIHLVVDKNVTRFGRWLRRHRRHK